MNDRRKLLVALAACGTAPWIRAGHAQRVYRIAVLMQSTERVLGARVDSLRAGLKELGYVEGKNLLLSVSWNEGGAERFPAQAAELLRARPDVIVASNVLAAQAVFRHTRTLPIVLAGGTGAVEVNLAQSLARPGGNVTGVTSMADQLVAKQIELLKTIIPAITSLGVLTTGRSLVHEENMRSAMKAAQVLKLELIEVRVSAPGELVRLRSICGKGACQALFVEQDGELLSWLPQIIESAARLQLPIVSSFANFAENGGLMSYSSNSEEQYRRAATFVDKILKGAKPGDLPIEQPTKFDLIVNMKTAKALGLTIPQSILVRAHRLID